MAAGIRSMGFLVKQIMLLLQQLMDGYRFSPTEEELINYLKLEEPGCREGFCIIPTIANIYEINPSDLQAKFSKESIIPSKNREWWFICPQMQNQRISRKTPCGSSWKITGKPKDVVIYGKTIGSKRTLVFPDGRGSKGGKSDWVIHEYHLPKDHLNGNYVLCHLMDKQFGKADNSTTTSEHGVIDLAELQSILNQPDDDVSFPEKLVQARMDEPMEPRQHQNQIQFSLPGVLHLFKWGLRSQSLFSEVQKGEEPRLEKVQQETAVRNIEPCISLDEEAAREKHKQDGEAANSTTKSEDGAVDLAELESLLNQPDDEGSFPEHLIQPKMNSLAEPSQLQNLLQLQSQNNSFPSTIHQFTNIGSPSVNNFSLDSSPPDDEWIDATLNPDPFYAEVQKGEKPRLEKVRRETAARNIEPYMSLDEAAARAKHSIQAKMKSPVEPSQHQKQVQFSVPDPPQLRSQNNSVPSTIHQFTNIGSPSVGEFSSDDILEPFLKGEEARLEKVQQETAARNIEPCMSLDETAARAKNGQISITENCQIKIEPFDGVFPLEETGGIAQSTFNSSHFSGLGYEEHDLAGSSPKRRRLNMPGKNQIQ